VFEVISCTHAHFWFDRMQDSTLWSGSEVHLLVLL
jgi:hypothetical protein